LTIRLGTEGEFPNAMFESEIRAGRLFVYIAVRPIRFAFSLYRWKPHLTLNWVGF